ncbi:MAG: hypothetical protein WA822_17805, partial [Albidovulum sp.]
KDAAKLFEAVRSDLPCMDSSERKAKRYKLSPTGNDETQDHYKTREFGNPDGDVYLTTSYELRDGKPQNTLSVSVYGSGEDYPANLTNAFADIWDLPAPTPLRTDPATAQFNWQVTFPNGAMQIIVSYSPSSGLTQIYGRTLDLRKDQINGCPR